MTIEFNNKILVGTFNGLILIDEYKRQHKILDGINIESFEEKDNCLFISTSQGIWKLTKEFELYFFGFKEFHVNQLIFGEEYWFIGTKEGLYFFNPNRKLRAQKIPLRNDPIEITNILIDSDQKIWVTSENGIYLFEKNNFKDSNLKGPRTHFKHHKKPKVGHFQSINGLYDDLEVKRIQRKTRLINIPDNWDKNPFLLQTYK